MPSTKPYNGREHLTPNFSLRSKGFGPHIYCSSFKDSHLRDGSPKQLAVKANRACIYETHKTTANKETVLNRFVRTHHSYSHRTQQVKKKTMNQSFPERGLLSHFKSSCLRFRLQIQHVTI